MVTNLTEIKKYLDGKHICLLGNARSILKTDKDIDSYDVICRMNLGFPQGHEKKIGSRTDILFISTKINENKMLKNFNPKYIVWMVKSDKRANEYIKQKAIQNPFKDWDELRNKLTLNPSTGLMSIYFLLKHINFKRLTIYGFESNYQSGTWYHNLKTQKWHNFEEEQKLIQELISYKKDIRIYEE